jgi:hypothetical protein
MKRYVKAEHNPYPTVVFNVTGWKSSGQQTAKLHKSFDTFEDACKFARSKFDYYRIDVSKSTQYDGDEYPSTARICQFKYGEEQNRSFV